MTVIINGTAGITFPDGTTQTDGLVTPVPVADGGTGSTSTTYCSLTTNVTGTLPVANGGTGAATLTANNVLLGNGTSAVQVVAPGTTGNLLTSNGTTWTSAAPAAPAAPSTAQVLTAYSGAAYQAVGTFIEAAQGGGTTANPGSSTAGSNLVVYNSAGSGTGSPSGTYRNQGIGYGDGVGLWFRTA
jgi:hypothetical protein